MICINTNCGKNDRNECTTPDSVRIGEEGRCMAAVAPNRTCRTCESMNVGRCMVHHRAVSWSQARTCVYYAERRAR